MKHHVLKRKSAPCSLGEKEGQDLHPVVFMPKQTKFKSDLLCLHVMDPATFLPEISVLGTLFSLLIQ